MPYAPKKARWPCMGVTSVPCVQRFTAGHVCARPSRPAPMPASMALPMAQCSATRFGGATFICRSASTP
jgi:hypothetical protein